MQQVEKLQLAVVTGTTSGIGLTVARQLLDRGWTVAGIARRTAEISHPRYHHIAADLADLSGSVHPVEAAIQQLLGDHRPWQRVGLVNNAASADLLTSFEAIDPLALLRLYALNIAAPVWLMGLLVRESPREAALRIVNVSSGAAVGVFPGLAAYGSSKAALRMAGMVAAAELASQGRRQSAPSDVAILSFEPGIVDTPMQQVAREQPPEKFPSVQLFRDFAARGVLVPPEAPAAEIVGFLEADRQPGFAERRFGA